MVDVGKPAPDFKNLPTNGEGQLSLSDFKGKYLVLYFYPKDNTPGCTKQGEGFRDLFEEFTKHETEIVGVSKDSVKSHDKFVAKYGFPFKLISDESETLCKAYDVIKEKNMYGRTYLGVERSTFLIGPDGNLVREWRKVRVKGHVDAVFNAVVEAKG